MVATAGLGDKQPFPFPPQAEPTTHKILQNLRIIISLLYPTPNSTSFHWVVTPQHDALSAYPITTLSDVCYALLAVIVFFHSLFYHPLPYVSIVVSYKDMLVIINIIAGLESMLVTSPPEDWARFWVLWMEWLSHCMKLLSVKKKRDKNKNEAGDGG